MLVQLAIEDPRNNQHLNSASALLVLCWGFRLVEALRFRLLPRSVEAAVACVCCAEPFRTEVCRSDETGHWLDCGSKLLDLIGVNQIASRECPDERERDVQFFIISHQILININKPSTNPSLSRPKYLSHICSAIFVGNWWVEINV